MRVLSVGNMYPPHHLGGYELMWHAAVAHLRDRGHEVRVLTSDYRNPAPDSSLNGDRDVSRELRWYWRDHDFPRLGPVAVARLERHNAAVLDRHLEDFRPEVVSWWAMGGMSLSLITRVRLPALAMVHDDWLLYGPRVDRRARFTRRPSRRALEDAADWLFASRTLLERARADGWRLSDARVANPGIDLSLFRPPRADRSRWDWRLLCCGRIDERKGVDLAIRALAGLPDGARLRVVGAGDEKHLAELRELARELGLHDRVSFTRLPRDELPSAYAEADVTLFPVRWEEPFGLVPLESMAMGTPVIASGRGGSGEYLDDGRNCLLADPDAGPAALAAAVERLAGDAGLRARLSERGIVTAEAFGAERFVREVERGLRLSRPPRPAGS